MNRARGAGQFGGRPRKPYPAGRTRCGERRQCASHSMTGGAASRGVQVQTHLPEMQQRRPPRSSVPALPGAGPTAKGGAGETVAEGRSVGQSDQYC